MPAVRARRPGRGAEPPKRGRRKSPPPALDYGPMPRLARIKLSGGLTADHMQVSSKSLMLALTGAVLFVGAAIAGAAWLGSSLFDVREAMARAADSAAANAGFVIADIEVAPLPDAPSISPARAAEVRRIVAPADRRSILSLDPEQVRARIESLDWVASARVRRLWPSTLKVEVERRQEYALWRDGGELSVIDVNGARLVEEQPADHPDLPLIVGSGAGPAAEPLLVALESLPELRARLGALVRVNERRWNVELRSGMIIALPEEGAAEALARLEALHARYALLDRPVAQLDMRAPGRLAVRVHAELAGGRRALGGA